MSQSEKLVGAVGLIRVGPLEITVAPLSQGEELGLDRELRRAAEAAAGDHYTRCRPLLEAAKDSPADRVEILREITRLTAQKVSLGPAALHDFRVSPAGLAIELYHRGRKATPGLDRTGLAAVITEGNADTVAAALFELLAGDDDESKSARVT